MIYIKSSKKITMKKNSTLLLLLCLMSTLSIAQPVLDSSNTCPAMGDVFIVANCNGAVNIGSAGANQTWDLSTFSATNSTTYACMSASGSLFPASSVKLNSLTSSMYYKGNASSLEVTGIENTGAGVNYTYSNTEKLLTFPFQLGDSLTDTWANSFDNGLTFFRQGTSHVLADGYGTVILPVGTFGNVLRVRTVQTYTDSIPGLGIMYSYVNTMYNWYMPGQHQPIASVSSLVTNGSSPVVYGSYLASLVTASEDVSSQLVSGMIIYPNPATQVFNVNLSDTVNQLTFNLTDFTGREIPLNVLPKSSNAFQLTPSKKLSGTFILTVKANGKTISSGRIQCIN
jgi:hypothetical protein